MYKSDQQDKPPPRDYRKEVTDDIIKLLEEGTAPWQRPWQAGEFGEHHSIRQAESPIEAPISSHS
jgi:antirestriction protein ArdC